MADKKELTSRDDIRSAIFGAKAQRETVEDFFGVAIELRQPTLQVALTQRDTAEDERLYFMLTDYAFVPGTDEKVFEEGDIDALRELPFGPEFTRLMDKVNKLLGIDPKEVEARLKGAQKSPE